MRLRIRYTKLGKIRFIGHRDLARIWERVVRVADLPVAYTRGFTPRPKFSFGPALPTGYESVAEYLDVDLDEPSGEIAIADMLQRLTAALPAGCAATAAVVIDKRTESLQEAVHSCSWSVEIRGLELARAHELAAEAWGADQLPYVRVRKGEESISDLRPALRSLSVTGPSEAGAVLEAELEARPQTTRPCDLVAALAPEYPEGLVRRLHQWIERDGEQHEPTPCPTDAAPRALERAS